MLFNKTEKAKELKVKVIDSKTLAIKEYTIKGTREIIEAQIDYITSKAQVCDMPCKSKLFKLKNPKITVLI